MPETARPARGRPRLSSREMLEDAAFELFLENGYAGTTVELITQRAGVSRNTFFNYFRGKSDVFWVDLDESVTALQSRLADQPPELPVMAALERGILSACAPFGPSRVPWVLTHYDLIGSTHELQASALSRFTQEARIIAGFVAARTGTEPQALLPRSIAYAAIGAIVAAAQAWAAAGESRGEFVPFVAEALRPLLDGFGPVLTVPAVRPHPENDGTF
jgi:AcrR family transcriptional regulator